MGAEPPGQPALKNPSQYPRLKDYVHGWWWGAFANDKRIVAVGRVWNEAPPAVPEVIALLPQVFRVGPARLILRSLLTSGIFSTEISLPLDPRSLPAGHEKFNWRIRYPLVSQITVGLKSLKNNVVRAGKNIIAR